MMKRFLLTTVLFASCIISQAQEKKLRVAVLDPTTSGIAIDEGTKLAVQELISSVFVNTGRFVIIERSMIDKIIKEQSFQNSDLADNSQATEIGKLAGANKVVLSAVSLVGGRNMLSIKIIDVMTASIDQQKTKIVSSNDLLDAVEPLTLELLGEKANYVKQNTVFSQENSEPAKISQSSSPVEKKSTLKIAKSTVDYNTENKKICEQISTKIESIKSTPNSKLSALIANGKIQSQVSLSRGLNVEINSAGIMQISGNGEMMAADEKLLAPYKAHTVAIIVREGVTKVRAFSSFSNVQYVLLPNNLQSIEEKCFSSCSKLIAVNIPSTVTQIGKNAFKNCKSIQALYLSNNIENIGAGAFSGCENLTVINIPNSITIVSESQFKNCKSLREIIIPESVVTIGKDAFMNCRSVQSLYIPDNVISIGEAAFQHMHSLYEIRLSEKISIISAKTFDDCRSLVKLTCPVSVTSVGEEAFSDCSQLIQIVFLSENLNSLGKECFDDCDNLGNIVLYSLKPPKADHLFGKNKDAFSRVTLSVQTASYGLFKKADFWEDFEAITTF